MIYYLVRDLGREVERYMKTLTLACMLNSHEVCGYSSSNEVDRCRD